MKYKHVVLPRTGGPTVLQVVEDELPEPGTNEVRVKILAAGVSFSEVLMRHGQYPGAPPMPFAPGYDMVGVVEKRGPGVSAFEVGQTVAALTSLLKNLQMDEFNLLCVLHLRSEVTMQDGGFRG